jgi:hypothetical protein
VAVARRQGARVVESLARLVRARVGRASGEGDETILTDLDAALTATKETGAFTYEPFLREELGRLHNDQSVLSEALRRYHSIGATGHARRLEAELNPSAGIRHDESADHGPPK